METAIGGAIVGAVVAVAAPSILSGVGQILRPVAKGIIKGGILTYNAVSDTVAGAGGEFNELISEAKSELKSPAKSKT